MALDFPFEDFLGEVTDGDLIDYDRPSDVVADPELTLARKRELLAYWASDIHAVTNFPALRTLSFGKTASIDVTTTANVTHSATAPGAVPWATLAMSGAAMERHHASTAAPPPIGNLCSKLRKNL